MMQPHGSLDLGLAGRHAVVTGASQGIGRAIAGAFAGAGARVSAVARNADALAELVDELGGESGGHGAFARDLTQYGAPAETMAAVGAAGGPVDIVVHCIGGNLGVRDAGAPAADWQAVWRLNVGTVIDVNNAAVPGMVERGWGRLVMFSSRAAIALDGAPAYSSAKAALNAYIGLLGRKLAGTGVVACGLMPGVVAAPGNNWDKASRDNPNRVADYIENHMPLGRLGTPGDIVPFVLLLASDHNSFGAGTIIPLDGGTT